MAELLKDIYSEDFLIAFGKKVKSSYNSFNQERFLAKVMDNSWEELKLKERMRRIATILKEFLPACYRDALDILYSIDEECVGFPYLFFPDFVSVYGQLPEDWELSMQALERFTQRSSAEFAIRSFLLKDPERVMRQMMIWSGHSSEHVRRLASEGCRPRLPWGESLPMFKRDPAPVLAILEQLKADTSLYVRKSVANNLNDISKDHPDIALSVARKWIGIDSFTDWVLRQGCRNLIRKGLPEALELFGYANEKTGLCAFAEVNVSPASVQLGDKCELKYHVIIREGARVKVRLEYGIEFVKARGNTSRKLFLICEKELAGGSVLAGVKTHKWSDLTTRRHYPGEHQIILMLNGKEIAETRMTLKLV